MKSPYSLQIALYLILASIINCQPSIQQEKKNQLQKAMFQVQGALQSMQMNQQQIQHLNKQIIDQSNQRAQTLQQINKLSNLKVEQLRQIDKQLKSWNEFVERMGKIVANGNDFMDKVNQKLTAVMARVVGFEEELKAIISLDTIILCLLTVVLVKILKDEFLEEGYQPVNGLHAGSSTETSMAHVTTTAEPQTL